MGTWEDRASPFGLPVVEISFEIAVIVGMGFCGPHLCIQNYLSPGVVVVQ